MAAKNNKQFGLWIDSQKAIIVGREQTGDGSFMVLAHEKNMGQGSNSSENAANNAERTLQQKFFKEISSHMQNVEELHVTGTGQAQERFIRFMKESPQFRNTITQESTSNEMSEEKLLEYITKTFN